MLDGVTLDQLRSFIASVNQGSFSAAARKLRRAQSVVSDLVSSLEGQMGVRLFDRSARYPKLTPAGIALLADARGIEAGSACDKVGSSEGMSVSVVARS
jgi:DNA-binding transcriptional LysR family regulator